MNRKILCEPNNLPISVVCFGSGAGSTLEALLKEGWLQELEGKPLFKIRAVLVNRECRCIEIANRHQLPLVYINRTKFFSERNRTQNDAATMIDYDANILENLRRVERENGFVTDLIALTGYSSILHSSLVNAFLDRIINSHPADLSKRNSAGQREYAGLYGQKAVHRAITGGERATKTCIHLVTERVDEGEILVTSAPLPFPPEIDAIRTAPDSALKDTSLAAISRYHQELQKKTCDYPAYISAINLIALGRLSLGVGNGMRTVFLDGNPLPYEGVNLENTVL